MVQIAVLTFITLVSGYFAVVVPVRRAAADQRRERFQRDVLYFKLKTVRRYYSELEDLSCVDFARSYDIDKAYYGVYARRR